MNCLCASVLIYRSGKQKKRNMKTSTFFKNAFSPPKFMLRKILRCCTEMLGSLNAISFSAGYIHNSAS